MNFNRADEVEQICYSFKQSDFPRASNRALVNDLFNGKPPYSKTEEQENDVKVNVNDLSSTSVGHDARSQFYQLFMKPGNYFRLTTDAGPVHKRQKYSTIVTKEIGRIMKRSLEYIECLRSKFALDVLHGIGPAGFQDSDLWCPQPLGVEDVLVPANTLLTMKNMPFFAIYKSFTGPELSKLARSAKNDPGWNEALVDHCLEWIDEQTRPLMGGNWPDIWSPEKTSERIKGDGGLFSCDQVPVINAWDFYYWNDDQKVSGWNRRMIIDTFSTPTMAGNPPVPSSNRRSGTLYDAARGHFLYNPGKRKWGNRREEIINWQFADLSAVAPFRYHSVRSLGWLLYSVCHLQNRLRCKISEAQFEALTMYLRIKSEQDIQRALSVNLINKGFVDDNVQFIPASERYQPNVQFVELGLRDNQNIIERNRASYNPNPQSNPGIERTKFEVMAEVNAMTSLVSSAINQAYLYQIPEYREIHRRFCKKESRDPDVRLFQANCLRQGVPTKILYNPECWDLEPERIMGGGNKTLEMAIAQQLMQFRSLYDPEPQRQILRDVTLAITDDAARTELYVPELPEISNSVHDTELVFNALMNGVQITPKSGLNNVDVITVMLGQMQNRIGQIMQTDGMGTPQDVNGLNLCAGYTDFFIKQLGQNPNEKPAAKRAGMALAKMMNEVRGMQQRQQKAMEEMAQQQGGPQGPDPKEMAKIEAMKIQAEAKAANTRESHAERTAQRQLQWEMDMKRKQQQFESEMEQEQARMKNELERERHASQAYFHRENVKAGQQLAQETAKTSAEIAAMKVEQREKAKEKSKAKESD